MSRTTLPLENKSHRYLELDSLRGLAAGSVVIWHFLMFWVTSSRWHRIVYSPTVLFYKGSAAVLIFFVLSGFVLSLPFLARPQPYPAYLAKRICRIYVPYAAGLALAVLGWRLTPHVVTGNWWIDQTWNGTRGWRFVALQFTGLVMPGSAFLNTAYWSLIVELRISLIFPAVIWITRRIRFWQTLALTLVGSFLTANPQQTTYFGLLLFLNGSALAVHREQVAAGWRGLSRAAKILLLVVACGAYCYADALPVIERHQRLYGFSWWVVSVAAMVFLVVAMQSLAVRHWLHANAILRLGTLSYSIYLVHGTVLFTLIHWFWGRMSRPAIFGCYAVATYGLAEIFHGLVERPTIVLSRRVGALLTGADARR